MFYMDENIYTEAEKRSESDAALFKTVRAFNNLCDV